MQIVEDVEESFLGLGRFASPELYVVDDEHIDEFVEVDEVVGGAGASCFGVLLHKLLAGDVEHLLVRVQFLGLQSDGIGKVSLAETHVAVQQQRVEGGLTGFLGHGVAGGTSQAVAVALDEVLQGIVGAQLRIDAQLVEAGNHKRVGNRALAIFINIDWQFGHGIVSGVACLRRQGCDEGLCRDGLIHHDAVFQHASGTQLHSYHSFQEINIMFLYPFIEERTRHLDQKGCSVEL